MSWRRPCRSFWLSGRAREEGAECSRTTCPFTLQVATAVLPAGQLGVVVSHRRDPGLGTGGSTFIPRGSTRPVMAVPLACRSTPGSS